MSEPAGAAASAAAELGLGPAAARIEHDGAAVRVSADGMTGDAQITIRRSPRRAIPLLERQVPLGDPVEIVASEAVTSALEVTVPFDPGELARRGIRPAEVVVVQWNPERTTARELRPVEVDLARRTVTARTVGLSVFQACTAGFRVHLPLFMRNAAGETLYYADPTPGRLRIAGQVEDRNATVALHGAPVGKRWGSDGWFVFEAVANDRADTVLTLEAQRPGRDRYVCDLLIRRSVPRKTVASPPLHATGTPAIGTDGTAYAATVVRRTAEAPVQQPGLRTILANMTRAVPALFTFDPIEDTWQHVPLISDRWIENAVARRTIHEIRRNMGLTVPVDPADPEETRELRALDRFIPTLDVNRRVGVGIIVSVVADLFSAGNVSTSTVVPCLPLDRDRIGVAFAVASADDTDLINSTWDEASTLAPYHGALTVGQDGANPLGVHRARLLYREAGGGAGLGPLEVVADGARCAGLVMRRDPERRPAILALGTAAIEELEPGVRRRVSGLLLHRRVGRARWETEIVTTDAPPVIDADLAYLPDGRAVVAAMQAAPADRDRNGRLRLFTATSAGWASEAIRWRTDERPEPSELGMWPRLAVDSAGVLLLAFIVRHDKVVTWWVARQDGASWVAREVGNADVASLTGELAAQLEGPFDEDVVGQSRVPLSHWAPAIAAGGLDHPLYVWTDGTLRIGDIDPVTLTSTVRRLDVDRNTGFFPQLVLRPTGAPIVTYKDPFGHSDTIDGAALPTGPELHWVAVGEGPRVPDEEWRTPSVPARTSHALSLRGFGQQQTVTCNDLQQLFFATLVAPAAAQRAGRVLQANLLLNSRVDVHADVQAGSVELTLRRTVAPDAPADAITEFRYRLTSASGSVTRRLSVTEQSGAADPCGISQEGWDALAGLFLPFDLDPAQVLPDNDDIEVHRATLRDITMSIAPAHDVPTAQGALRFTINIPSLMAEGEHKGSGIGFTAQSTTPSLFEYTVAPHLVGPDLAWHVRAISGRYGHVDVDVDTDFVTWIGLALSWVTGNYAWSALISVDPTIDRWGTNLANEPLSGQLPPFAGVGGVLLDLLAAFARDGIADEGLRPEGSEFEAVYLRGDELELHVRRRPTAAEGGDVGLIPAGPIHFGFAAIGETTSTRNVLVVNNSALPVLLTRIEIAGVDFTTTAAPRLPSVVAPGASAVIGVAFRPRGVSPGPRAGRLDVRFDQDGQRHVDLLGDATAPPLPRLTHQPRELQFGVVVVGQSRRRTLLVHNEGTAPLTLDIELEPSGSPAPSMPFTTDGAVPNQLAPQASAEVGVRFAPVGNIAGQHAAVLRITTNDSDNGVVAVPVTGQSAPSDVLVQPQQISFNPTTIVPNLPPGLPPDTGPLRGFVVYNTGAANLRIAADSFTIRTAPGGAPSPHFGLRDAGGGPLAPGERTILAGQFLALSVRFRPQAAGPHEGALVLTYAANGTSGATTIEISGTGIP